MLAVVVCAIALSLAYPVREYIAQRRQIDQLQAQSQATTAELARLRAEALRLNQPAYIEQQAQDRLHMCLPGASCYVIIGGRPAGSAAVAAAAATPWYERLWHSVRQADQGSADQGGAGQGVPASGSARPGSSACAMSLAWPGTPRWSRSSSAGRPGDCAASRTAARAGCPDVVETAPRLDDGTPFPTLFYLTCPRAAAAVSRLESGGLMRDMQQRLAAEPELRAAQQAAHRGLRGPAGGRRGRGRGGAAPARHAERGRHAGPGQMPARPGRARARRARRQPAGPGSRRRGR